MAKDGHRPRLTNAQVEQIYGGMVGDWFERDPGGMARLHSQSDKLLDNDKAVSGPETLGRPLPGRVAETIKERLRQQKVRRRRNIAIATVSTMIVGAGSAAFVLGFKQASSDHKQLAPTGTVAPTPAGESTAASDAAAPESSSLHSVGIIPTDEVIPL